VTLSSLGLCDGIFNQVDVEKFDYFAAGVFSN
jgi:hypothetical protein